jgi:hypothetical protein
LSAPTYARCARCYGDDIWAQTSDISSTSVVAVVLRPKSPPWRPGFSPRLRPWLLLPSGRLAQIYSALFRAFSLHRKLALPRTHESKSCRRCEVWIRRPCPASPRTRAGGFESDVVPVFASSPTCSPSSTTGAAPIAHRRRDLHCNTVARVTRNLHASIIGKKSLRLFAMPLGWFSVGSCGWAPKSRCGSRRHVLRRWAEHRRVAGLGAASPSPLMPTTSIRICIFLFSVCTDWSSGWGDGG